MIGEMHHAELAVVVVPSISEGPPGCPSQHGTLQILLLPHQPPVVAHRVLSQFDAIDPYLDRRDRRFWRTSHPTKTATKIQNATASIGLSLRAGTPMSHRATMEAIFTDSRLGSARVGPIKPRHSPGPRPGGEPPASPGARPDPGGRAAAPGSGPRPPA